MSVRSHRAWGQTSLGSFAQTHPCSFPLEGTFSFTGRTGGSRHWKWERKKRIKEKMKMEGKKKKSVFSNVLWKKCSFQNDDLFQKVVWKNRSFLSTDTVFDKRGLRQHPGRWHWLWGRSTGTSHMYVTPMSSTQEGFFRLPWCMSLLQG